MTAHETFAMLAESIRRCARLRSDTDANRDELIAEAVDLTPAQQADMRKHFDDEAAIWATATGRGAV